jgi:PAS domain-containing protein
VQSRAETGVNNLELFQRMLLGEAADQVDLPILLGDSGAILAANQAACRLLDYPLSELLERAPADITRLQQQDVEKLFAVLRGRGRLSGTIWLTQRDGTGLAMEFQVWLVTVAGAPAWFAWLRPAIGQISSEPIVLADTMYV